MLDGLKKDLQQLGSALEARLTPQWGEAQQLCRFRRGAAEWEFSYLAPSPQGQSGALLRLTRNGKYRFEITLRQPDIELAQWRDALHDCLTQSDQRDIGLWLRFYLRVRGRRIECSRLVMQQERTIGLASRDVDRYYLARLCGWTEPCVLIVHTDNFKTSNGGKASSSSVRLLPAECRQMADAVSRMIKGK